MSRAWSIAFTNVMASSTLGLTTISSQTQVGIPSVTHVTFCPFCTKARAYSTSGWFCQSCNTKHRLELRRRLPIDVIADYPQKHCNPSPTDPSEFIAQSGTTGLQAMLAEETTVSKKRKRKRKHYAFWRQFYEKPSIIPGCPGTVSKLCKHAAMLVWPKVQFETHAGLHLEEVDMLHLASLLCIDGVLSNIHEGLGCNGGSGGDACTGEQVLLHQVHPPHQQVGVAHRAPPHAAVHLNQARPPACILQLHMEYPLHHACLLITTTIQHAVNLHTFDSRNFDKMHPLHHVCSSQLLPNTLSLFTLLTLGTLMGCTVSCGANHMSTKCRCKQDWSPHQMIIKAF